VIWGKASPCTAHPYLTRKGVQAHRVRLGDWPKWSEGPDGWRKIIIPGALLVPMVDEAGALWNLQAIFPEAHPGMGRDKDFMGGRKAGLLHIIGEPSDTLLIAEGYATAATVHEATGFRTFVAFDCGNLKAVAMAVRKRHPGQRIVICADNDRHTAGNPGLTKAREAALAVGGFVSVPEFPEGAEGTDFNDLAALRRGGEA
jgi:putative DNA primase/helicase